MEIAHFYLPAEEEILIRLINDDDRVVHSKYITQANPRYGTGVVVDQQYVTVLFEIKSLMLQNEDAALERLVSKARLIKADPGYFELKNAKQRELYLLKLFGISGSDAATVMELLKDEMAWLLRDDKPP